MEASRSLVAMVPSLLFGLVEVLGPVACIMVNKLGLRATSLIGATMCILAFAAASCSTTVSVLILSFSVMGGTVLKVTKTPIACLLLSIIIPTRLANAIGIGGSMVFMPYNLGCSFYFEKKRALATGIATR